MHRSLVVLLACFATSCTADAPAPAEEATTPQPGPKAVAASAVAEKAPVAGAVAGAVAEEAATKSGAPNVGSEEGADRLMRMRSDLRNLMSAQEVHYAEQLRYAGPTADANQVAALHYRAAGDVIVRVDEASDRGWSAVASSAALPGRGCAIFIGEVEPPTTPGGRIVTEEGLPQCDE